MPLTSNSSMLPELALTRRKILTPKVVARFNL